MRMAWGAMCRRGCGSGCNCGNWRIFLRCGCGGFGSGWGGNRIGFNRSGGRRGRNRSRCHNGGGGHGGCRNRNWSGWGNRRLDRCGRLFDCGSGGFVRGRGCDGRFNHDGGLDHDGRLDCHGCRGRRDHNHRTRRGYSACRSLGNHRPGGRMGGNGRSRRKRDDGRRGSRLGNDSARFRTSRDVRNHGRRRGRHRRCRSGRGDRNGRVHGRMALPGLEFLFLLLGLNGLEHIARLGDVGEIDFGRYGLRGVR